MPNGDVKIRQFTQIREDESGVSDDVPTSPSTSRYFLRSRASRSLLRVSIFQRSFGVRLKSVEKRPLKAVAIASLQFSTPESHSMEITR